MEMGRAVDEELAHEAVRERGVRLAQHTGPAQQRLHLARLRGRRHHLGQVLGFGL